MVEAGQVTFEDIVVDSMFDKDRLEEVEDGNSRDEYKSEKEE